jgi:thiol-disulfide isomerase/thioredoxin
MILGAALVVVALLTLVAGGCGGGNVMPLGDRVDFQQQVLRSPKPVLVDFYKGGGCPTCQIVYPLLDQLADEYRGRVVFAKFEAMTGLFQTTSTLSEKYAIRYFPTVVLFVDGKERKRFILDYNIDNYRQALNEVTRGPKIRTASTDTSSTPAVAANKPL